MRLADGIVREETPESVKTKRRLCLRIWAGFDGGSTAVGMRYCKSVEPTRCSCLISIGCDRRRKRSKSPTSQAGIETMAKLVDV